MMTQNHGWKMFFSCQLFKTFLPSLAFTKVNKYIQKPKFFKIQKFGGNWSMIGKEINSSLNFRKSLKHPQMWGFWS